MNLDYIAGLIDGEGTIGLSVSGKSVTPYISIANSDKRCLDQVSKFLSMLGLKSVITKKNPVSPKHKIGYSLRLRYRDAITLSALLYSKLIIKQTQAGLLAFEYDKCTPRSGKYTKETRDLKDALIKEFHNLNSRGA